MEGIQRKSKQSLIKMLFKSIRFKDKNRIRKETKESIRLVLLEEIPYSQCNEGLLLEYIDLLLNETQYNTKTHQFYYYYHGVKINLSIKLLSIVAVEYIKEHLNDFLLEKHQQK